LLKFRVEARDKILKNHLRTARHSATFISKMTQNETIELCGETVRSKIIEKVKI